MDVIDNVRSAMLVEFENNQKAERAKFQLQLQQLKEEHQQQIKDLVAKGKIRDTAEQQVRTVSIRIIIRFKRSSNNLCQICIL